MGMTLLLCYMLRNDAFDAVYFVPAESGLWNEEKKTMNQQPITSLKGIGEKTAKLFAKLGVETVEELLHDYPRPTMPMRSRCLLENCGKKRCLRYPASL